MPEKAPRTATRKTRKATRARRAAFALLATTLLLLLPALASAEGLAPSLTLEEPPGAPQEPEPKSPAGPPPFETEATTTGTTTTSTPTPGWRGVDPMGEPNTPHDTKGSNAGPVNWAAPNAGATDKVYFDAFLVSNAAPYAGPAGYDRTYLRQLNTATGQEGRIAPAYSVWAVALLGFWRDCNGDGFIGDARTGQREYVVTSTPPKCPFPYTQSVSTSAGTVLVTDEFRAIGPEATCQTTACKGRFDAASGVGLLLPFRNDAHDVSDSAARVWGDWGRPGEALPRTDTLPFGKSTLTSTNGLTQWVDNQIYLPTQLREATGYKHPAGEIARQTYDARFGQGAWDRRPCLGENRGDYLSAGCNEIANDPTQPANRNSLYPLALLRWRYNDSEGDNQFGTPLVKVWNCEPGQPKNQPSPGGLAPVIAPGSVNPSGSIVGTYDHAGGIGHPTSASAGRCTHGQSPNEQTTFTQWPLYGNLETSTPQGWSTKKHHVDFTFTFQREGETVSPLPQGLNDPTPACDTTAGATLTRWTRRSCWAGGLWMSDQDWLMTPPRENLRGSPRLYATFYADTTIASGLTLPAGVDNAHTYGVEPCPMGWPEGHPDWDCNKARWTRPHGRITATLHDKYDLRDVDEIVTPFAKTRAVLQDFQADDNRNGYGDEWEARLQDYLQHFVAHASDPDGDGLTSILEFRWLTLPIGPIVLSGGAVLFPNARDYDEDNWEDNEEVAYWNDPSNDALVADPRWTQAMVALTDPDFRQNFDRDNLTTTHDPDSDDDGILDGVEYKTYRTYPEFPDSDCAMDAQPWNGRPCDPPAASRHDPRQGRPGTGDGIPDGEELAQWNRKSANAWTTDYDGDGIANNLLDPDADGDGVLDGDEFLCRASCTDPALWDSDRDGLLDGPDVTLHESDPRYQRFAQTGIVWTINGDGSRTYKGEASAGTDPLRWDTDGDALPDGWEVLYGLNPRAIDATLDKDLDEFTNLDEYNHAKPPGWSVPASGVYWGGTNPSRWDTDGDGLPDGWEARYGFNPLAPAEAHLDPDNDALTNLAEYQWGRPAHWSEDATGAHRGGTRPDSWDTDADGLPDGWEARYSLDPTRALDANLDPDRDGLTNAEEYGYRKPAGWSVPLQGVYWGGTLPQDPDTDGDELLDGAEVKDFGTDPFQWDTDGDGLPDAWEARYKWKGTSIAANPLVRDANADGDADSANAPWCTNAGRTYTNLAEYTYRIPAGWDSKPGRAGGNGVYWGGTRPNEIDTDGDGTPDGYEVCVDTDPTRRDLFAEADDDNDGLTTSEEVAALTRSDDPDTDEDGLCDGGRGTACRRGAATNAPGEVKNYGTNPLAPDTDGEGWLDGPEAIYWDPAAAGQVPDSDGDGLRNLHDPDSDNDGLNDWEEYQSTRGCDPTRCEGSDPGLADTDGDGLTDRTERAGWTITVNGAPRAVTSNPSLRDTDLDGLNDNEEKTRGTDPRVPDTDGDGLNDALEINGWTIVVNGVARRVTSDPTLLDTDGDGLHDGIEFALGSDPRARDTDADGLWDSAEDENRNGRVDEGETDPLKADTDGDGLSDGLEASLGTDALALDSDEDGLTDGEEVNGRLAPNGIRYTTDPTKHDTDDDYLPDGEEIGIADAGGDPRRITDPRKADTDGDGLLDGEEVHFYALNPLAADTDCDGLKDGTDPNPYYSNLPPGQTLTPAQRAGCATSATTATPNATPAHATQPLQMIQGTGGHVVAILSTPALDTTALPPQAGSTTTRPATEDVGLLVPAADGTITVFARPPVSENAITSVTVLLRFHGKVRVDATGTQVAAQASAYAELEPTDEPNADSGGTPYPYAIRVPLPEGMTEATGVDFALTFADENLNAQTYTGGVSGQWTLAERTYEEDMQPGDTQDHHDPTGTTEGASGWEYRRVTMTGGANADGASATMACGAGDSTGLTQNFGQGSNATGHCAANRTFWIYRIIQPPAPALVGHVLEDGTFDIGTGGAASSSTPTRFALYADTLVRVNDSDYPLYTTQGWFNSGFSSVKRIGQGVTRAVAESISAASNLARVVSQDPGRFVWTTTQGILDRYDQLRADAESRNARVSGSVIVTGTLQNVVYQPDPRRQFEAQTTLAALDFSLVMLSAPTGGATSAAAALSTSGARTAGTSLIRAGARDMKNDALVGAWEFTGSAVNAYRGGNTGAATASLTQSTRYLDIANTIAKDPHPAALTGFRITTRIETPSAIAQKPVMNALLEAKFLGARATTQGAAQTEAMGATFRDSTQVTLTRAAQVQTKLDKWAPEEGPHAANQLVQLLQRNVNGLNEHTGAATRGTANIQKGKAYERAKALDDYPTQTARESGIQYVTKEMGRRATVSVQCGADFLNNIPVEVDLVKGNSHTGKSVGIETKDTKYLSLDKRTKKQVCKLAAFVAERSDFEEAWLIVKNGRVSEPLKKFAKERGVKIFDDVGVHLNP